MVYKRFEMDLTKYKKQIKEYFNDITIWKGMSEKRLFELEKNIFLKVEFAIDILLGINLEFNVVNETGEIIEVVVTKNTYKIKDLDEMKVIFEYPITLINDSKCTMKNYTILLKLNMEEKAKDNIEWKNILTDEVVSNYSCAKKRYGNADAKDLLKNLFFFESSSFKGQIILIYYYLYFLAISELESNEKIFNINFFKDIINKRADYLGVSAPNSEPLLKESAEWMIDSLVDISDESELAETLTQLIIQYEFDKEKAKSFIRAYSMFLNRVS